MDSKMNNLEVKENIKKNSERLARLGMVISQIKFSYKIKEETSKEYWENRINEFEAYKEKSLEYYNTVCSLMKLILFCNEYYYFKPLLTNSSYFFIVICLL